MPNKQTNLKTTIHLKFQTTVHSRDIFHLNEHYFNDIIIQSIKLSNHETIINFIC